MNTTTRNGIGGNNPPEPLDNIVSPIVGLRGSAKYLNLGLSTVHEKMNEGEFEIVRLGGRTFLTRKSLDAYIQRNLTPARIEAPATPPAVDERPRPSGVGHNGSPEPIETAPKASRLIKRKLVPGKQQRRRKRDDDEPRAAS
jgi:hypothetical protein